MSRVKERTRRMILDQAKTLFMTKGIGYTFMEDIAQSAGKTRRTLYRYFATKDELAFEVLLEMLEVFNDYQMTIVEELKGTGLEQLESFLHKIKNYMNDRIEIMMFIAAFDFYFKDSQAKVISEEIADRFESASLVSENLIHRLIDLGIKDGSIKAVDHVDLIVGTISNVLWAFAQRVAIRGKTIYNEIHLEPLDMIGCQIDMYITYLRKEN